MKIYQPINGLLGEGRRRRRRGRFTFGLFSILGLGLAVYWAISAYRDPAAEARTDRIISLSSPDFTEVLSDEAARAALEERLRDSENDDPGARRSRMLRPDHAEGVIERNQTLFVALRDRGVERSSIQQVVDSLQGTFDFRRSRPGDRWEVRLDEDLHIRRFRYRVSPEEIYEAWRVGESTYESAQLDIPTETIVAGFGGTVLTSVYDAVAEAGEAGALAGRFLEIFGWDFDFSQDARPGDTFRVLVEKVILDGEFLRYGRVLAAEYTSGTETTRGFAYASDGEHSDYYLSDGTALRRTWLRAPLQYRRISSTFTRRRYHPVLQRYRPHLGIDYAAATGTPIWAMADGEVTFAGERGGNGNLVTIRHANGYETIHAHLSQFADGVRRGREVRQGDVIGFVGSTGLSTGPHLHFGVRLDGEYTDPALLESAREPSLRGDDLTDFLVLASRIGAELDSIELEHVDVSDISVDDEPAEDLPSDFGVMTDDQTGDVDE